jgi:hypothetical protein
VSKVSAATTFEDDASPRCGLAGPQELLPLGRGGKPTSSRAEGLDVRSTAASPFSRTVPGGLAESAGGGRDAGVPEGGVEATPGSGTETVVVVGVGSGSPGVEDWSPG